LENAITEIVMERNVIHRLTATISSGSIISLALAGEAVAQTIGSALVAQQLNYNAGKNLGNWTQRFPEIPAV